jgi:Lantibiotic dehydratase, N terminus
VTTGTLTPETQYRNASVRAGAVMLMRVGGLPVTSADGLKDDSLPGGLARSEELAAGLAACAKRLSASLYETVSRANGDAPLQHALLAVRRGVFNGRRLNDGDVAKVKAALDEATLADLNEWRRLKELSATHGAESEKAVQRSLVRHRAALRRIAQSQSFRKGLLLSSPSFERALDEYVRFTAEKLDKKLRRTERTLLSYLLRTTHKTSPFSTLTAVSMVRFNEDAPAYAGVELPSSEQQTAVRPNLRILSRIGQALRDSACEHPNLRLTLHGEPVIDGCRVKYWKRAEQGAKEAGHITVSENNFWIHLTPSLQVLLDEFAAHGVLTVAETGAVLSERLQLAAKDALEYVRLLIDNGFLDIGGLRQSLFDPGCWIRVADGLSQAVETELSRAGEGIRNLLALTAAFEASPLAGRSQILQEIGTEVRKLLEAVGDTAPAPSLLVYEDSRLAAPSFELSRAAFEPITAAFAELQPLLSLFDPLLVTKASLKALFRKRFGRGGTCADLLWFSDFFHEVFYRPYQEASKQASKTQGTNPFGRGTLNPLKLPEVSALEKARNEFTDNIQRELDAARRSEQFEIPHDWVTSLGANLAEWHGRLSNSFFFQPAVLNGETVAVLNHVYSGYGCMFTRFMHLFAAEGCESLEAALRAHVQSLQPEGVLFAEMQGGHDTNLNQHNLLTEAELVLPGERGMLPIERQIFVQELALRHDAESDEVYLYCGRLDKRIVPLYLGMFYPMLLPELQTMLLHFLPPTILRASLVPVRFPEGSNVLYQPRVRYKQVILERAKWTVSTSALPVRNPQELNFDFFVRFDSWRKEAGIPAEAFALLIPLRPGEAEGKADGPAAPQKPFYVDLQQPLFLLQLEKLVADNGGYLQFTECLPSPKDTSVSHGAERYVSEFVIDITQGGGQ